MFVSFDLIHTVVSFPEYLQCFDHSLVSPCYSAPQLDKTYEHQKLSILGKSDFLLGDIVCPVQFYIFPCH